MHEQDVREFINDTRHRYDFILVDLEEAQYSPAWVNAPEFLTACRECLAADGVLTVNLIPRDRQHYTRALAGIREVFERLTLCLPVPGHDNQLIMAFRSPPELRGLDERLPATATRWGINFQPYWEAVQANNPSGSGIL